MQPSLKYESHKLRGCFGVGVEGFEATQTKTLYDKAS